MSRIRLLSFGLAAAAFLALLLGFVSFANGVRGLAPPVGPLKADAIVALTGGSLDRLREGVRLLRDGAGQRLLISGVNPAATDADIAQALEVEEKLLACCIDLGRSAVDTIGNAAETAQWAKAREYDTLILVTEDYHMPRSLLELRIAMPEVRLIPYPVSSRTTRPEVWRNEPRVAGKLAAEYLKLLTIQAREALFHPAPTAAAAGSDGAGAADEEAGT